MKMTNNIKLFRKSRGLTQAQLAKEVGCTQSRIADYEAGRYKSENATLSFALKIAEALDCTIEDLFTKYGGES